MKTVRDAFWQGRLHVWQPARGDGYRFNIDPVLLAANAPHADEVMDLGAGCGIVGLLLLAAGKAQRVHAVEVQDCLADLIERNAVENGFAERLVVHRGDLRRLPLPRVDAVVFNPPYFATGTGHGSPNPCRDAARRELNGTLGDFARQSAAALRPEGRALAIVRHERAHELSTAWQAAGCSPVSIRSVRARSDVAPQHALVGMGAPWLSSSPLIVHAVGREFSQEVAPWVAGSQELRAR